MIETAIQQAPQITEAILRPYQNKGVKIVSDWFLESIRMAIIADETGLGKSGMSLRIAKNVMKKNPHQYVLIICPAFLKGKWAREILKWLPEKPGVKKRKWSIVQILY